MCTVRDKCHHISGHVSKHYANPENYLGLVFQALRFFLNAVVFIESVNTHTDLETSSHRLERTGIEHAQK